MGIRFINNGKSGGQDSSVPNIFVQENEPTIKKGIWLQSSKSFNNICVDTDIIENEAWEDVSSYNDIPTSMFSSGFSGFSGVSKGNDVYMVYGNETVKFDAINKTYTKLTAPPHNIAKAVCCIFNNRIYMFGSSYQTAAYGKVCSYNILTNSYANFNNAPQSYFASGVIIDSNIYLFGGSNSKYAYKFDLYTYQYSKLMDIPKDFTTGSATVINGMIYLFGCKTDSSNSKSVYKYNPSLDIYTALNDLPYTCSKGCAIPSSNGSEAYIFLGQYSGSSPSPLVYKYNSITDTYSRLANMPIYFSDGLGVKINEEKILLLGGTNYTKKIRAMNLLVKEYPNNSILISQGMGDYKTELINTDTSGNLNYYFHDVWHYTRENGLDKTIPTYYGNGTEWVKFKN